MRFTATLIVGFAIAGLAGMTLSGLLAPFSIILDLPNHFRPHLLAGLLILGMVAALLKIQSLMMTAMAFVLLNFALAVPPFFFMAPPTDIAGHKSIKAIMANVWGRNSDFMPLGVFLRSEHADIVLLAEADPPIARMLADLSDLYPYRVDCIASHYCRLALLSRFPIGDAQVIDRSDEIPPHVIATIDVDGRRINVVGTHLARPYSSRWQTREIDFLVDKLTAIDGPLIMLGDFNATPWSWTMLSLQLRGGLSRHMTLGASWPAHLVVPPQLLLEHVLSRGGITRNEAHLGPNVNSDHLPLVASMALPTAP